MPPQPKTQQREWHDWLLAKLNSPMWLVPISILIPGSGLAAVRKLKQALVFLALLTAVALLGSFLSARSSIWLLVTILSLGFIAVGSAIWTYRETRGPQVAPNWQLLLAYVIGFFMALQFLFLPKHRVTMTTASLDLMEPTFSSGDHVAMDRHYTDYKPGDLVMVDVEDEPLRIRRIQAVRGNQAVITTDSPEHSIVRQVRVNNLRGKVLYVTYSWDPEKWFPQWHRFLHSVH